MPWVFFKEDIINKLNSENFYLIIQCFSFKLLNRMLFFVLWMPLKSRCSLLIFRSHGQSSRSNCWYSYKWCLLVIFSPLCLKVTKLDAVDALRKYFRSHGQRSRPNCWSFKNVVCSISLGLFAGDVVKLGTKMFPIDFLLTLLKAKVKLLICTPSVVCSISSDLLLDC